MFTVNYCNDFFEIGQQKINFSFYELSLPDDDPVYNFRKKSPVLIAALLACNFFFLEPIQALIGLAVIPIILYKGKYGRKMWDIVFDEETILSIGQLPFEFNGNMETYNNLELEQGELAILLHCNGKTFKIGNGKFLEVMSDIVSGENLVDLKIEVI